MGLPVIQGHEGFTGVGLQTAAIGTSVAATVFQEVFRNTLRELQPEKAPVPTIKKTRHVTNYTQGHIHVAGDIDGPLTPDEWFQTRFFADVLGGNNAVSGDSLTGYTHTFSEARPTTPADFPTYGLTVERLLGGDDDTTMSDFAGCFVNGFTLTVPESGPVTMSGNMMGRSEANGGTAASPTYSSINPFERYHVDLQLGANLGAVATTPYTSLSLTYSNNIVLLRQGNNQYPTGVSWGIPTITGSFTYDMTKSLTNYNYFKNNSEIAASIILTHTELAGSSSGAYSMTFNIPKITFVGDSPTAESRDKNSHTLTFGMMLEQSSYNYALEVVSVNSESGTYSVN